MRTRVLLSDDHLLVREGLRNLLQDSGFDVVGEASDGRQAVKLARELQPDIAVVDIGMPELNGVDAAREILRESEDTRVILLTVHTEDPYVIAALRNGVRGYVLKTQAGADLVQAIRAVCLGETYLSPGISRVVVDAYLAGDRVASDPLTPREREVLQLVAEGRTTKELASVLCISAKTAESHRASIMQKLDIHDVAGLVRYAIRRGLITA